MSTLGATLTHAQTAITGYAEGENLGLIHMDYSTGDNTTNKTKALDPTYFIGNREDFYIDLDDPDFSGPGNAGEVTTIYDIGGGFGCDDTIQACIWDDYAWSPRIGWVAFDGIEIQNDPDINGAIYPGASFPHISYDGFVSGFAWGNRTGWIALSSCSGLDQVSCDAEAICTWNTNFPGCQLSSQPAVQNSTEWGVYLDLTAQTDEEIADCGSNDQVACLADNQCTWDGLSCNFEGTPRGRFFEGFGWSERLGWIGFENAATTWSADATEPDLNIDAVTGDHLWFSNNSNVGTVTWEDFAQDGDSGIDITLSNLNVLLDTDAPGDFTGCYNGGGGTGVDATFSADGNAVDVFFSTIGSLPTAPYGFCKYTLTGEIVNGGGLTFYIGDPGGSIPAATKADPEQYRDAMTIYTFAGVYDESVSTLVDASTGNELADGADVFNMRFTPQDLAGNPIVPVQVDQVVDTSGGNIAFEPDQNDWMRDVELAYSFDNNAYFDTINPSQTPGNAPVVLSDGDPVSTGTTYTAGTDGTYPSGGISTLIPTSNSYNLNAISFAPTSNTFDVTEIDLRLITAELPAITTLVGATPASTTNHTIDQTSSLSGSNPLPLSLDFATPLSITNQAFNEPALVIGKPIEMSYDVTNDSTENIDYAAIDHEMNFYNVGGGGGFGEEVLEIRDIEFTSALADSAVGQTDLASSNTRYAVINPTGSGLNSSLDDTVFFNDTVNHHASVYNFESDLSGTASPLDTEGRYTVDASFYGLGSDPEIDRADFTPGAAPFLTAGSTGNVAINLTPVQTEGLGFQQAVEFELSHHYLAYRMENAPATFTEFAVYEASNPISGISVQNIGLNTSGLVSGEQVFESATAGRVLTVLGTNASAGLQREINRNAAELTRNVTPCSANTTLNSLSTVASSCIFVNDNNQTAVAYYQGSTGDLLELGDATGTITVPNDYTYTIIVDGGADVLIRNNFTHGNESSNFGLIVFDDDSGAGGNVYLDPYPTNMVGLLYTEGSLLSSPDGSTLYYGDTGDITELSNQLYWQGKIASENTLGGAPNLTLPPGISCPNTIETLECAQRYDLDFLRRFATFNTPNGDYSLNNGKFSGDGVCNDAIPDCTAGAALPSTIELNANDLIDVSTSKSVDPVYIEPDARPTPPGFIKQAGVTSGGVVR